jgi:IS30 family transposase
VVETRTRVGDWEGDLIVGRQSRSAVATLVERAGRLTKLVHLPRAHTAETVRDALKGVLGDLPEAVRLRLTWDQGSEMAYHDHLTALLADGVFFAYPACPWQRGSNENTNGLLRQYLPKGTDLSIHTAEELRAIEQRLNNRPRKVLNWRTPAEVFSFALAP